MHSLKYLNGVLTVLAVVLTLNLWVTWTAPGSAPGTHSASEQLSMTQAAYAQAAAPPNASQQRREMRDLLKLINTQLGDMKTLLTSGEVRVRAELPQREEAAE